MERAAIHVTHQKDIGWTIKQSFGNKCFGNFRKREYAEAYARALAHRGKLDLIVHQPDGQQAHVPASDLTYPVLL